jgi:hypothetical protein
MATAKGRRKINAVSIDSEQEPQLAQNQEPQLAQDQESQERRYLSRKRQLTAKAAALTVK